MPVQGITSDSRELKFFPERLLVPHAPQKAFTAVLILPNGTDADTVAASTRSALVPLWCSGWRLGRALKASHSGGAHFADERRPVSTFVI